MTYSEYVYDMVKFGAELINSKDIDPVYPVLETLYEQRKLRTSLRHWQTCLYLAFYSLPSALQAFEKFPTPDAAIKALGDDCEFNYPIAVERRGLSGGKVRHHLADLLRKTSGRAEGFEGWLMEGWQYEGNPNWNFKVFFARAQNIWNNGRWAAFKWCELLKEVHKMPLEAPDLCLQDCTGPLKGLCMVTRMSETDTIPSLNTAAKILLNDLYEAGLPYLCWEQLETLLCNYHSYKHGKYYVGHDIDEMQQAINRGAQEGWLSKANVTALFEARKAALPKAYLGEFNGWSGIRKEKYGR